MPTPSTPLYMLLLNAAVALGAVATLAVLSPPAAAASAPAPPRALVGTTHAVAASRPAVRPTRPRPAPRPATAARHRAAPHRTATRPATRPAVRRTPPKPVARVARPTWAASFAAAVARIPGYRSGDARWVVSSSYGHWGTADWYNGVVYVSPTVPRARLYDVVAHEWSHLLSVRVYGGDVDATTAAMNGGFGGTGLVGAERAADCMARQLGATWTHYTSCSDPTWRAQAARLLQQERL